MSNHDDFWTSLAAGHTNTVLAGAMDSHLSGKSIDESFGSVRTLTDVHRQANALSLPVEAGTKVVFAGGLGAHMSYDDVPADGITGEVVTVKSATGSITHHDGKVFVKWADGKFRPIHAEHLRLAGHGKQASGNTLKVLRDGREYWIERGGHHRTWDDRFKGPFTAADVVGEVEKRLKKDPDVVVMGRNHSLGRSGAADAYSTAPFVILDRRGDVVDEGYTLEGLWNKWFDRFLGWRMASSIQASDVKATFEKIKALAEKKPKNKFLKDLLKQMADEGFTPTEKQMKVVKEIEGEIEQQSEMKKELKGLDKDAAFDPSIIGEKKGGPVEHDPEDKNIMRHFGQGDLHGMAEMVKGKTATFRVASLGDLTQFLKVADGTLVHKSTKDLWSFNKDADGNFLVSRLFDDEGEPLKV